MTLDDDAGAKPTASRSTKSAGQAAATADKAKAATKATKKKVAAPKSSAATKGSGTYRSIEAAEQQDANLRIAEQKAYVTDRGVTRNSIKLGTVNMHGVALGNLLVAPMVNGLKATLTSINDRGGVLGRRVSILDCDDGPGEVSRTKACVKKLVVQDKIFMLLGGGTWGTASIHDDLKQHKLPYMGVWAYSQTEWQDPYMFPTHMSMIHEAMAGAQWAKNVIKPKTYGLVCLTSPEMQLACKEVQRIMDGSGARMVKKADVSITEASMSGHVLSMRAANPEHIIHYVINPATMAKFMVEAAQQGYYPPKGISGNHLAAEVLGSIFGKTPAGRYWTNTTYKLWGTEFMSIMNKYVPGNRGLNHHVIQASYVGALMFEAAAKAVGPNLTRERLMAQLANGGVYTTDASLDQRFVYSAAERGGTADNQTWSHDTAQGREFMYMYANNNTVSNPDGSPSGFEPEKTQFVIYTGK